MARTSWSDVSPEGFLMQLWTCAEAPLPSGSILLLSLIQTRVACFISRQAWRTASVLLLNLPFFSTERLRSTRRKATGELGGIHVELNGLPRIGFCRKRIAVFRPWTEYDSPFSWAERGI